MSRVINLIKILIFLPLLGVCANIDTDINKASIDANRTKKHVMLFLHKDNCGYCEKMIFQLEEQNISRAIKKDFILLVINRDDDEIVSYQDFKGSNAKFLKALGVDFYPLVMFIDSESNEIIYTLSGYKDIDKILVVYYISSEAYKKMSLEDFRDELFFDK